MRDFLTFRTMLTPVLIQGLFWIGAAVIILVGLGRLIGGQDAGQRVTGVLLAVLGPLAVRVYAELLIVLFKIHESLEDIREYVRTQAQDRDSAP